MQSYKILDAMELPAITRGGGNKGSKFFTDEVRATIAQLQPKQGFIMPAMELEGVKNPLKRQCDAVKYRVNQWAAEQAIAAKPAIMEGDVVKAPEVLAVPAPKFTVCVLLPAKDDEGKVLHDGGIAIRREK